MKRVLIGFDRSQNTCAAFSEYTDQAYSCDLVPGSGKVPGHHLQMDFFEALCSRSWDLVIAHPPCTYLSFVQYGRIFGKGFVIKDPSRFSLML